MRNNKIIPLAFAAAGILTLTGCLKDKDFDNGVIQSVHSTTAAIKVVEIKLTANSNLNVLRAGYDNSTNDTTVDFIPVHLATDAPASQDIHVTLVQNDNLVSAYNEAHTDTTVTPTNPNPTGVVTHYLVPTNITVVNGGVVTIPKGQRTGYLQIKFKPSDLFGQTYALGFTISSVQEPGINVSGNLQNGIVVMNIKNQWDGNYHVKGVRVHPTLGPFPFEYDADLNTASTTSVDGNVLADLGEGLTITINPDNTVSLTGDARDVFLSTGPGLENKYDPATKTFTLSYYYNTGAPRKITETLVRNP